MQPPATSSLRLNNDIVEVIISSIVGILCGCYDPFSRVKQKEIWKTWQKLVHAFSGSGFLSIQNGKVVGVAISLGDIKIGGLHWSFGSNFRVYTDTISGAYVEPFWCGCFASASVYTTLNGWKHRFSEMLCN